MDQYYYYLDAKISPTTPNHRKISQQTKTIKKQQGLAQKSKNDSKLENLIYDHLNLVYDNLSRYQQSFSKVSN